MHSADRDVPRVDHHSDLAARLVGRVDELAALEPDARQAVLVPLDAPVQEVGAGEGGDERVVRPRDEILRRAQLAQLAVDQHADRLGQRGGVLVVVGHDQRRQAELVEQLLQLGRAPRPSCARRAPTAARRAAARRDHARAPARAQHAGARRRTALAAWLRRAARCGSARAARRPAPSRRRRRCPGRSGAGRARTPGTRARPAAPPGCGRVVPSSQISSSSAIRPTGRARPAIARSTERLACTGRPDQRDRPLDLERELQLERAKRKLEVCREGCHERISLRNRSRAALMITSSALIASAASKSSANSS